MTPGDGRPRRGVLLALFAAGLVLLNFPMLTVWDQAVTVLGLPLLPVALFAIWAGLVGLLAWASEGSPHHHPPRNEAPTPASRVQEGHHIDLQ